MDISTTRLGLLVGLLVVYSFCLSGFLYWNYSKACIFALDAWFLAIWRLVVNADERRSDWSQTCLPRFHQCTYYLLLSLSCCVCLSLSIYLSLSMKVVSTYFDYLPLNSILYTDSLHCVMAKPQKQQSGSIRLLIVLHGWRQLRCWSTSTRRTIKPEKSTRTDVSW